MTTSGEPPSRSGGVDEPDWIDQILERATQQVDVRSDTPALPIVPDIEQAQTGSASSPHDRPGVQSAPGTVDRLGEISWVDGPPATPASVPIGSPEPALVPQAVGRSAWDDDLASVGTTGDPEGWDKLSWRDLDERPQAHGRIEEQTSFGRMLREWGPILFVAVAFTLFVRLVLVQAYHIPSGSMIPTLDNGDRVVVNRLSYRLGEIDRGQVVVFAKPAGASGENDLIKRVIGLPGETVQFVDNQVYIDGFRIEEPYLAVPDSTTPRSAIPGCVEAAVPSSCTVPDGYVFVMGDNRQHSSDSRVLGPIPIDSVVGRAFVKVWPLNDIGQL